MLLSLPVDAIQAYTIPEEKEDYSITADPALDPQLSTDPSTSQTGPSIARSNLRLFPPPLFSRQGIPQNYKYVLSIFLYYSIQVYNWILRFSFKANPSSVITTTVDEATGVEHKRMVNKGRWKGYGPASISFTDPSVSKFFASHTQRRMIRANLAPYQTASQRRESKTTSGQKTVGTPSSCEYLMTCLHFEHWLIYIFHSTSKNAQYGLDRRYLANLHHLRRETFTSTYSLLVWHSD